MNEQRTRDFFRFFIEAYPLRSAMMVALLVLAGMAEGVGVLTLVPILEFAENGGTPDSTISQVVTRVFTVVNLEVTLGSLLTLIVLAIGAKAALLYLGMREVGFTIAKVTRDLRLRLIRALFRARWRYFGSQSSGSFAASISSETNRAAAAYREACSVFAGILQIGVYVAISTMISWRITLFALVSGGILAFLLKGLVQIARDAGQAQTRLHRSLSTRLIDVLKGIKPLKAMAREDLVLPLLEEETEGLNHAQRRQVMASEGRRLFHEPALTVLLAIGLYFLLEVANQPLSEVLILAFVFYRLMQQINNLQMRFQIMGKGESAFWAVQQEIEEAEAEQEPMVQGEPASPIREALRIEGVTFSYDDRTTILRDLDLVIPAGAFVGVYGESGVGKTTLADLVLGLHRPSSGEIWVDDRALGTIPLRSWRRQIGYVPQDLLLFNTTILENVTLGDESLTREDAERALKLADAWDFVCERPDGMDAKVGESGGMFSGGQRQRIAIARALVSRPSLLILDEVTTALDPETEAAICETLRGLRGEVTILSISHQMALREAADITYRLDNGKLVQPAAEPSLAS